MVEVFRKLFGLLSSGQQKRFAILSMFMIFVALAEVFGLSSILVLLNVLSNPEAIADSKTLSFAYQSFGFETIFEFQIFLSTVAFFVVLVAQVIKTLGAYAVIRFSFWRGFSISTEL